MPLVKHGIEAWQCQGRRSLGLTRTMDSKGDPADHVVERGLWGTSGGWPGAGAGACHC